MHFTICITVFVLAVFISVLFSKFLNDGYTEKLYSQKIDGVASQLRWLGDQVAGVDFMMNDSSNSLSAQTDDLAASLDGRVIILKSNYKIIKDTHTDFQDKFFINDDILDIMNGKEERIVIFPCH